MRYRTASLVLLVVLFIVGFVVSSSFSSAYFGSRSGLSRVLDSVGLVLATNLDAQSQDIQYGAQPMGKYKDLGIRDGIYNNGQAAFWDLHVIDYYRYFGPPQRARGYRPEQPVNFSHVTHVQQNKMECQYCHWTVTKSAYAAIPEEEACMGCHKIVSSLSFGTRIDEAKKAGNSGEAARLELSRQNVEKLEGFYQRKEPIPWVKVHVMPNYVHFNHKRHVKAGVTCQECHGQVPNMQVVERASSMKMGWCVECHRERGTSIDCYTCHY